MQAWPRNAMSQLYWFVHPSLSLHLSARVGLAQQSQVSTTGEKVDVVVRVGFWHIT